VKCVVGSLLEKYPGIYYIRFDRGGTDQKAVLPTSLQLTLGDLLSQRSITALLSKLAHDVLEVSYAAEILHIDPELRRGHLEDD
jgi:hypothetical protein